VADGDRSLAIFIDFENLALGFQGRRDRFDIVRVLERLVEKGKIVAKKAYADWNRFAAFTHGLHEAAIELIEIPRRGQTGKNSADIRLVVDAMDLAYSKEHINTFAIVSGDSDFSPLVSKLKELGKHVIGLGMHDSTSELLRDNCDEFIYYEDLGLAPTLAPAITSNLSEQKRKAFSLVLESLLALRRENKEVLWSSMVKDTIKRKKPSFNETYHGYRTFSELLEDAQREGILELETDKRSRTYVVTRFGSEMQEGGRPLALLADPRDEEEAAPGVGDEAADSPSIGDSEPPVPGKKKSRRRRRRGGAGNGQGNGTNGEEAVPFPLPDFQPVEIPPGPKPAIAVVPAYAPLRETAAPAPAPTPPRPAPARPAPPPPAPAPRMPEPDPDPTGFGAGIWSDPEPVVKPASAKVPTPMAPKAKPRPPRPAAAKAPPTRRARKPAADKPAKPPRGHAKGEA
jgi:uncharacterized protein (TIGR00288 family)